MPNVRELKAELAARGIELPQGCLEKSDLEELLRADDREKPREQSSKRQRHAPPGQVHVITWNPDRIAPMSGENTAKLRTVLKLLEQEEEGLPDVLAIQETMLANQAALEKAYNDSQGFTWFRPPGSVLPETGFKRGVALLVRDGSVLAGGSLLPLPWDDEHRVMAYNHPCGLLVAAYMPAVSRRDGRLEKRLAYEKHLAALLREHRSHLLAVVGDLNIAPDDVDCSSEWGKFFLDGEDGTGDWRSRAQDLRQAHLAVLDAGGLVDAWRHHHSQERQYTSFQDEGWQRSGGNGWQARVDHVLVPRAKVANAQAMIYSAIGPRVVGRYSDHVPVGVRVELQT